MAVPSTEKTVLILNQCTKSSLESSLQSKILKKSKLGDKVVELLLDRDEKLIAKIKSSQFNITLPNYCIEGIPQAVQKNKEALKSYVQQSHLVTNPTLENGKISYVVHVHLSLLGGGQIFSREQSKRTEISNAHMVLGLDPNQTATKEQIDKAFREMSRLIHPDRMNTFGEYHQQELNDLYLMVVASKSLLYEHYGYMLPTY